MSKIGERLIEARTTEDLVREFFKILDTKEESGCGVVFSPVFMSSCRVLLTQRLNSVLTELKTRVAEPKTFILRVRAHSHAEPHWCHYCDRNLHLCICRG